MIKFKQFLTEGYKERVAQAAQSLAGKPFSNIDFVGGIEKRLGGKAWKDFQKDVKAYMIANNIKSERKTSTRQQTKKIPKTDAEWSIAYQRFMDFTGETTPDVEPYGKMRQWALKQGYDWELTHEYMDNRKRIKKYLGDYKDLHDYVMQMADYAHSSAKELRDFETQPHRKK